MNDEFLQWLSEPPLAVSLDAGSQWLLVDDVVRAEERHERAEQAHWARTNEAFPPHPARGDEQPQRPS
jgi:DNA polymerase IIIc chi subunit